MKEEGEESIAQLEELIAEAQSLRAKAKRTLADALIVQKQIERSGGNSNPRSLFP